MMGEKDWARLWPEGEHRFSMGVRRGEARTWWAASARAAEVLAERRRWLVEGEENYVAMSAEGADEIGEASEWLAEAAGLAAVPGSVRAAAEVVEADWVVLGGEEAAGFPVRGGAVVFPSSWSLPAKVGWPLGAVHGVVPGLQAGLGGTIGTFLARLKPGDGWERLNWGLSADGERNHHPSRAGPEITAGARPDNTWVRVEEQWLTRLPRTGAVLFGIKLEVGRVDAVAGIGDNAGRLARVLETMDDAVAAYKGLSAGRAGLAAALREFTEFSHKKHETHFLPVELFRAPIGA